MANFANCFALVVILAVISSCHGGVEELLEDRSFVERQIACVLRRGPCDPLGTSLRASLKEILVRDCERCNPQQMVNARKVIRFMEQNYPDEWYSIVNMFGRGSGGGDY